MSPFSQMLSCRYFPARKPLARGSRAITPTLVARAAGKKRSSAARRTRLYTICTVAGREALFGWVHRDAVEADLAFRLQVVEHPIGLRVGDEPERGVVELQQVDVVGTQAPQRLLDREPDVGGGE